MQFPRKNYKQCALSRKANILLGLTDYKEMGQIHLTAIKINVRWKCLTLARLYSLNSLQK